MSNRKPLQPSDHPACWYGVNAKYQPEIGRQVNTMNADGATYCFRFAGYYPILAEYWQYPMRVNPNRKAQNRGRK